MGGYINIVCAVGEKDIFEDIILIEVYGDYAVLSDIFEIGKSRTLDNAVFRYHADIFILGGLGDHQHCRDLFVRFDGKNIYKVHPL